MPAGVVIAGGRSTRFGESDKAVAPLAGVPMIRRVADQLVDVADQLVVNCREDQRAAIDDAMSDYPLPVRFAIDTDPDTGPMAGIRTGLAACDHDYAVVVACDMPFVDPTIVSYLLNRADGYDAAVPRLGDGWFQPTHAVYRPEPMIEACAAALARGERRIVEPLFELEYVVVEENELREHGSLDSFENVNTREEFEHAETRLEGT
ncbi:molybdenum cofactor guanylyltransferase [Haladaptatus sp. W1]|uniref:molybdenum cofactor guanylyltransferase n=1 Tax=Haladaptatus sp. W1 TaxID=1897478 RepID=UPI000849E2D4|nr:molybdenum cofactor guanylyltransferase [Haladaptatus sp. W1]ODR83126.1 molybdenum cofactor guanylyltransferase [Haladaptatus sp. W1]